MGASSGAVSGHRVTSMLVRYDRRDTWGLVLYGSHLMADVGIRPFPIAKLGFAFERRPMAKAA